MRLGGGGHMPATATYPLPQGQARSADSTLLRTALPAAEQCMDGGQPATDGKDWQLRLERHLAVVVAMCCLWVLD